MSAMSITTKPVAPKIGKLEPDYTDSYLAWQSQPSPATRAILLKQVQPILDQAVLSAVGRSASPNVNSRARVLAAQALDRYDPAKGTLKTHLLSQLRSLQRVAGSEQNIISVPEQLSLDRAHLRRLSDELDEKLGRESSTAELADRSGLSLRRIAHIRQYRPAIASGSILDEHGEVFSPASALPQDTTQADAWAELVYHDLSGPDQLIMDHTLGQHGLPVLQNHEIATKLGITPGAVSQRKAKIQNLLDSRTSL